MWKKLVKEYIKKLNKTQLLEDIKKYKKLNHEEMCKEEFERKKYFQELNLEQVRMRMKVSSKVVPTVRSHFKRKYRNKTLSCPSCKN